MALDMNWKCLIWIVTKLRKRKRRMENNRVYTIIITTMVVGVL